MKKFNKIFAAAFIIFNIAHCSLLIDNCKADWVQMNGPKGAIVNCIASSGNIIFAGTEGAGVFYSTNNGINWSNIGSGWTSLNVNALLVNGSYIFAGTDFGVYVSTDNGLNWSPRDSMTQSVLSFAASGMYLFKGIENYGIYRSTNNGATWMPADSGLTDTYIATLTVIESNLFAGTMHGVFLSTNNGSDWIHIGLANYRVSAVTKIGTKIFAGTAFDGVFMSTNNGTNWLTHSFGLLNPYITDFEINGNDLYAGTGDGVFFLPGGGTIWNEINTELTHSSVLALMLTGTNLFAGTTGGGIFLSTNYGAYWTPVNTGLMYYHLVVSATAIHGTSIFAGTMQDGIHLSTDNGSSWTAVNNGLTHSLSIISLAISGSTLFAGTTNYMSNGGLFISNNNGANWYPTGFANQSVGLLQVSGSNLYAVSDSGIFLSANNGANWILISGGLTTQSIQSLAVNGSDIFVGTYGDGVFYSGNNGANWTVVNSGLTSNVIFALAINGSTVFAGTYFGGVFRTTNLGMNWYLTGLTNLMVSDITVKGTNVFVSSSGNAGIYKSNDNGISWEQINQGLPGQNVNVGELNFSQTDLTACVYNYGLWRRPLSEVISVKNISTDIPDEFDLEQNYPNPFNPVTNLEFGISDLGFVSLKVYDILGKEVATLVNEKLSPGNYKVQFDGSGLPSGIYFYQIIEGEYTDTKRMMRIQ